MFQRIKEILANGKEFVVTSHIDPDGDALGSAFALAFALGKLGKEAVVYLKDKVPYKYEFLPQPPNFVRAISANKFDAVFVVDCGDFFRVGNDHEKLKEQGPIINIDHHDTNEAFGYLNIIDERASSTAEIIYAIIKALDVKIDHDIAMNIYTAILTDTGSFRYNSTNSKAFLICEEMTHLGVLPSYVAEKVYESHPKERFLLLCAALTTLETYRDNRIAFVQITDDMFRKTGGSREHTEGFVEFLKEMRGVEVALVARQIGTDRYKISMRSKGKIDVASAARHFGGGGHKNAAGCVLEGSIDQVKKLLVEAFRL
ncbi:MAG TPA: bifunctional oligoribonuclease/PAP phosphatase NrnA [Syntrophorhabdales bacterium]|nr:bifunctional oligoribonuclease/PAP phosphatase NrnA [Syntrophorhabdales bacterium]